MRQHIWLLSVCACMVACEQSSSVEVSDATAALWKPVTHEHPRLKHKHKHKHHHQPQCETPAPEPETCGFSTYDLGLSGTPADGVFFDVRAPGVAYAYSGGLLWRSADAGETWSAHADVGPAIRKLSAAGTDPADLIATTTSGLLASGNAGSNWYRLSLGGLAMDVLEIPATQPQRLYVTPVDGLMLMSIDGGYHWKTNINYPRGRTMGLSVDPRDPQQLVATIELFHPDTEALSSKGAVVRSVDAGVSWQAVYVPDVSVNALARCEANPDVLLAATRFGVARSNDNGQSWTLSPIGPSPNGITELAINPNDCDDYWATESQVGPLHTRDGGQTFTEPLVQGLELTRFGAFPGRPSIDPADPTHVFLSTHGGFYTSHDSGEHWSLLPAMLHMTVSDVAVSPLAPSRAWLATWGQGVWTRENSAAPWTRIPLARLARDYTLMISLDEVRGRVIVGANPAVFSEDGVSFRELPVPGGTFAAVFHPTDASIIYLATQVYGMFKSTDAGVTWQTCNGTIEPWSNYAGYTIDVRGLVLNPAQPAQLFATTNGNGIYRSDDGAQSWTKVLDTTEPATCIVLVPGTPTRVYACTGGIAMSEDMGQTWTKLNEGLDSLLAYSLRHDAVSDTLLLAMGTGLFKRGANDDRWQLLDADCSMSTHGVALMEEDGQRYVLTGAGHGVQRHGL